MISILPSLRSGRFRRFLLVASALASPLSAVTPDSVDWAAFLGRNDLTWSTVPDNWTKGPFVGNGDVGALIYHEPTNREWLRLELSRSDLYTRAGAGGIRVPTGCLYLKPAGKIKTVDYRLDLWNAEARGVIVTEAGKISWRSFVHAADPVLRFEYETTDGESGATLTYEAQRALNTRPQARKETPKSNDWQPVPVAMEKGDAKVSWQPFKDGGGAATAVRHLVDGNRHLVLASLAVGWKNEAPIEASTKAIASLGFSDTKAAVVSHRAWWHAFYPASYLTVPDTRLESFYWTQLYKMASATRADRTVVDLMGPWFQQSAWLSIWVNLNIQLTYWPVYAANQLGLGESLVSFVSKNRHNLVSNVIPEWQHDSAAVGRTAALDFLGKAGGKGSELGNLPFTLHNLWWHYRYSMDDAMLRDLLYPLLARSVNFYRHNFVKKEDGKYHLPLATSPEYETKAEDCNYDLSLCRWACEKLLWSAERLKIDDPLIPVWKDILSNLAPYPVDDTGIMIGKDVPLAHSHRHFSHLFMIYPLATMKFEGADRELVEKSIRHWLDLTGAHAGYSYTGGAAMAAYLGDGDRARALFDTFFSKYLKPNTHYTEGGLWPVIETPLSGARSLQEMVLQSWGDAIRVFPGIPKDWSNASFRDLRTEGAFLVSAVRKENRTRWVRVESLAGEPCRIRPGMERFEFSSSRPMKPEAIGDGSWRVPLAKGEWAVFSDSPSEVPDFTPVVQTGLPHPWGEVKVPPPPPLGTDENGEIRLMASNAVLHGELLAWFKDDKRDTLGRWTSAKDYPSWRIQAAPGRYRAFLNYGSSGGTKFTLAVGASKLAGTFASTGGMDAPKEFEIGTMDLEEKGVVEVRLAIDELKGAACNLRSVVLRKD